MVLFCSRKQQKILPSLFEESVVLFHQLLILSVELHHILFDILVHFDPSRWSHLGLRGSSNWICQTFVGSARSSLKVSEKRKNQN